LRRASGCASAQLANCHWQCDTTSCAG